LTDGKKFRKRWMEEERELKRERRGGRVSRAE
jgi:hypothetical protein